MPDPALPPRPGLPPWVRATLVAAALGGGAAQAQDAAPPLPLWEAGVVGLLASQPAYPGARQRAGRGLALPYLLYRGPVLRAEQGTVGLRAAKTERFELDVGFAGAFGSSAGDDDARRGMPDIGTLVEFGPRLRWRLGEAPLGGRWTVELPLRGVFDLSHDFRHRGIAFEPALGWRRRGDDGWGLGLTLSAVFGDRRLADTFYGVAPVYATATRPAYTARAGLVNTRLALSLDRRLGADWRVFGFVRLDSVAGAANRDSPLVERRSGAAAGIGLTWTFARSRRAAHD